LAGKSETTISSRNKSTNKARKKARTNDKNGTDDENEISNKN
jgi:hypothetical protein